MRQAAPSGTGSPLPDWLARQTQLPTGVPGSQRGDAALATASGFCRAALLFQARPLTRYLPIRKEDFDLRLHIESSGHSVDTCYHVILTEKMCKGYLVKMGGKIKSWKKRWFVFDRMKRTLSYYVGESLPSPMPHAPHRCSLPVPSPVAPQSPLVPSLRQINTRQS